MPSIQNPIRGIPITHQPVGISRCGMSHATFAQHRTSKQWYELSIDGKIVGSPLEFDFYRFGITQGQKSRSKAKTQELSKI